MGIRAVYPVLWYKYIILTNRIHINNIINLF